MFTQIAYLFIATLSEDRLPQQKFQVCARTKNAIVRSVPSPKTPKCRQMAASPLKQHSGHIRHDCLLKRSNYKSMTLGL